MGSQNIVYSGEIRIGNPQQSYASFRGIVGLDAVSLSDATQIFIGHEVPAHHTRFLKMRFSIKFNQYIIFRDIKIKK